MVAFYRKTVEAASCKHGCKAEATAGRICFAGYICTAIVCGSGSAVQSWLEAEYFKQSSSRYVLN
jgi:hypothetical protein